MFPSGRENASSKSRPVEIAASDPKGAGRIYSKQARCSSGDATETPKASLIPAQGIRPGFIAPSTISSPEGATHPSSTPSNRLNALKQPIACTGKTGPYEPRANALGCYEAGRWPESNCVSPQTRIGQQGWPSLFTRTCLVRSFRGFPASRVWLRRNRKVWQVMTHESLQETQPVAGRHQVREAVSQPARQRAFPLADPAKPP